MKNAGEGAHGRINVFLLEWKGRAARSIEKRGLAATFRMALMSGTSYIARQTIRCFTRNPFNPWYQFLDRRYDRRHRVDTAGIDWIADVASESANAYSPVPASTFHQVMRQLDLDHAGFIFIDYGCGKAKTLLLAAESPFRRSIGIEISPRLAQAAQENVRTYIGRRKCIDFEVVCADAGQYELPQDPAVVYFYDPFKREVMATVLANIRRSLAAAPRELYIVYLDPSWRSLFDDAPFLVPLKQTTRYCIYKAAPGPAGKVSKRVAATN